MYNSVVDGCWICHLFLFVLNTFDFFFFLTWYEHFFIKNMFGYDLIWIGYTLDMHLNMIDI